MKSLIVACLLFISIAGCQYQRIPATDSVIASGEMPNIEKDKSGNFHLVYGVGDSIMYSKSSDGGSTFSSPDLIAVLPTLAASHMRGPQIAVTAHGLVVTACTNAGNIFSYTREGSGVWQQSARVNDVDSVALENLMALSADGENVFAVWLDLRGNKHNKIFGAKSSDGGKSWNRNQMIYTSPDTTVCECCKPSVVMKGSNIFVMFRNWLNGSRDLYLSQSTDGANSFGKAQKLGTGNWELDGCPMDGGGLALNENGVPQTVWNRKGKLYVCEPGEQEKEIGQGKGVTLASANGKNIYAWVENGEIVVLKPRGKKEILGRGYQPIIRAINNEHVVCIWENDKQIYKMLLEL